MSRRSSGRTTSRTTQSSASPAIFEPEQAKTWIKKYFGPLPRGPEIIRPKPSVPKLTESKHITMTDAVSLSRAELIWPTVPSTHPDEPALDVLAAILGGLPKENRLFRTLVYDRQLAAQVRASHPTHLLSGTFEVELYSQPGQKLDELVKIAQAQIEKLKKDGPTAAEVRKAQNERESELVMGMQSVTRKAALLNEYMDRYDDPLGYQAEIDKIFAVTPEDVKRVAREYLGTHFIELDVVPGKPASRAPETVADAAREAPLASPPARRHPRRLRPCSNPRCWDRLPDMRLRASSAGGSRTASSSESSSDTTCRS